MNPLRVAVVGCTGRMGQALVRLIARDSALGLAAAVTTPGDPLEGRDAGRVAGLEELGLAVGTTLTQPCDVVIEFTSPTGCEQWARWCAAHGTPLVSGTTGLGESQQAALRAAAARVPVVWAPNMSVGVNLLLELVADLAGKLGDEWDVEICETHHRQKVDAPSGTARALLEAVCQGRQRKSDDVSVYGRVGECGPRPVGQVGVHALRMGALVGEHEVHFASEAETLTLGHRAFARETFAAGALRAARWLSGRPPGRYSMRDVLRA